MQYFDILDIPQMKASAIISESFQIFRDEEDMIPVPVNENLFVMPWGADNQLPYNIMELIDSDETTATCMEFNTEVAFGDGIEYADEGASSDVVAEAEEFFHDSEIDSVFLGQCADMKMFNFCVSAIVLDESRSRIERIVRKEAAYCRFAVQNSKGRIPSVVYANWRRADYKKKYEEIPLLTGNIVESLRENIRRNKNQRVYAIVSRVPKASSTYYPIPAYASIFKSDWYDVKRLIGKAKKAKLKNSAPIKYHIQLAPGYWQRKFERNGISNQEEQKEFVRKIKDQMVDYLTGAENSGKVLFSEKYITPDGKEFPEIDVVKISSDEKEGGDYTTDIQEAVNMICFAMRVHSNLVGSVPGKAQSNNSGSDKRELYTIAQTLQRPYHKLMLRPHQAVCSFNGWKGIRPRVNIIQLTTLDEHRDSKTVEP